MKLKKSVTTLLAGLMFVFFLSPFAEARRSDYPVTGYSSIVAGQTVYLARQGEDKKFEIFIGTVEKVLGDSADVKWISKNGDPIELKEFLLKSLLLPSSRCGSITLNADKATFAYGSRVIQTSSYNSNVDFYATTTVEKCVGDTVVAFKVDERDYYKKSNAKNVAVGTIQRIFENGMAEVLWTEVDGHQTKPSLGFMKHEDLVELKRCVENICLKDLVYSPATHNRDGVFWAGTAERILGNRIVEVRWTSKNGQPYSGDLVYFEVERLKKQDPQN